MLPGKNLIVKYMYIYVFQNGALYEVTRHVQPQTVCIEPFRLGNLAGANLPGLACVVYGAHGVLRTTLIFRSEEPLCI